MSNGSIIERVPTLSHQSTAQVNTTTSSTSTPTAAQFTGDDYDSEPEEGNEVEEINDDDFVEVIEEVEEEGGDEEEEEEDQLFSVDTVLGEEEEDGDEEVPGDGSSQASARQVKRQVTYLSIFPLLHVGR